MPEPQWEPVRKNSDDGSDCENNRRFKLSLLKDPNFQAPKLEVPDTALCNQVADASPARAALPGFPAVPARPRSAVVQALLGQNAKPKPGVVELFTAQNIGAPYDIAPSPREAKEADTDDDAEPQLYSRADSEFDGECEPSKEMSEEDHDLLSQADAILPHGLTLNQYKTMKMAVPMSQQEPSSASASMCSEREACDNRLLNRKFDDTKILSLAAGQQWRRSDSERTDKFLLNGATLRLPTKSKDSLSYRIEALRVFLAETLGESNFLAIYRQAVDVVAEKGSGACARAVKNALPKPSDQQYAPLFFQLLHCEDKAFAN
jgi:hypothetical protein